MFGRFVIDLIFYGPALTFDGILNNFTFRELYDFWTGPNNVSAFIYRFLLEGPSLVIGWFLVGILGGNIPLTSKRSFSLEDTQKDAEQQIVDGFQSVLQTLNDDEYSWI